MSLSKLTNTLSILSICQLETESSRGMKWPKIRKIVEWALHELRLANKE